MHICSALLKFISHPARISQTYGCYHEINLISMYRVHTLQTPHLISSNYDNHKYMDMHISYITYLHIYLCTPTLQLQLVSSFPPPNNNKMGQCAYFIWVLPTKHPHHLNIKYLLTYTQFISYSNLFAHLFLARHGLIIALMT